MPGPFQVGSEHALAVDLLGSSMTVTVVSGDTVYYADQPYVTASSNQGSIANGASQTFTTGVWLKSASLSSVQASPVGVGTPDGWASNAVVTNEPAPHLLMSAYDTGGSDQTAAIQNALTAAGALVTNNGLSVVEVICNTRRKFTVGGAVTAGAHGEWAQIALPFSSSVAGLIRLVGAPRANDTGYLGGGNSGTVIESTLGSAPSFVGSRGIASVFGGPASFSSARTPSGMYPGGYNFLKFGTRDVTIRSSAPVVAGIDAGWLTGFGSDGLLQFDRDDMAAMNPGLIALDGTFGALNAPCTAPQAIPLVLPFHFDWYGSLLDTVVCAGWLGGPMLGELAHIRRLFCFYSQGAALYVDAANIPTRIDYFWDWNNAYGIASTDPSSSATPISPTATAKASGQAGLPASPVDIGTWNVQTSQGGPAPASTQRVYDVMDANLLTFVDCPSWSSTTDNAVINGAPIILGSGASLTGLASAARIKNKLKLASSGLSPALPASGTAIRNPYGRDALVSIVGGTVSQVQVNLQTTGYNSIMAVPSNGIIAVTYSVAPTWTWQLV